MNIRIFENDIAMGLAAAQHAAEIVNKTIEADGFCRIVLSTGASQFLFFEEFVKRDIDWSKVEMFHLDEYIGIDETHKASFCAYLKQRFISRVGALKAVHLINGIGDPAKTIEQLTKEINTANIHLGLIGIGENAHIAFNDPPVDFNEPGAYKITSLDERCKLQQVREGWFESMDKVCGKAITMTCGQIVKCANIISVVPYAVKAPAVKAMLECDFINPLIPATLLKTHKNFYLYLDNNSASLVSGTILKKTSAKSIIGMV